MATGNIFALESLPIAILKSPHYGGQINKLFALLAHTSNQQTVLSLTKIDIASLIAHLKLGMVRTTAFLTNWNPCKIQEIF
jgi:hypothetical protein